MVRMFNLKQAVCIGFLTSLCIGSPAFGEISLPTAVQFEKSIHFQKPDGEPVEFKPGIYEVAEGAENQLNIDPLGEAGPIAVQALPAVHDEAIEVAKALLTPSPDNNPDKDHLLFWMPDGVALEAVGSYSGVFSRSALTWGTDATDKKFDPEDQLKVQFDKATYFKTVGGEPKMIQPGSYEVGLAGNELLLTPAEGTEGETIHVETESLGVSAAVILPEFDENPALELLMLGTADGQSLVALGSHDGTFPRGTFQRIAKKAKRMMHKKGRKEVKKAERAFKNTMRKAKRTSRKAARVSRGKVNVGRVFAAVATGGASEVARAGHKFVKKHGKEIKRHMGKALQAGKKVLTKVCGPKGGKCLKVVATAAMAAAS